MVDYAGGSSGDWCASRWLDSGGAGGYGGGDLRGPYTLNHEPQILEPNPPFLNKVVPAGIGVHHAGLTAEERGGMDDSICGDPTP